MVVPVNVIIPVEDPATVIETYDTIRLYRDTSRTGAFSTLVGSATLDADTRIYTIEDTAGNGYWRYLFYDSVGASSSALGPLIEPAGTSLLTLRLEAAKYAGVGLEGEATGGSTTTLIDPVLAEYGVDARYIQGGWIYRPDATDSTDRCRRIAQDGFDPDTSAFTVARAWTEVPANGEVYHVFALLPPVDYRAPWSWDGAVREGLESLVFEEEFDLGPGTGLTNRFDISGYAGLQAIRWVKTRSEDVNGVFTEWRLGQGDTYWYVDDVGVNERTLVLENVYPTTTENVIMKALRTDAALYLDSDVTQAPFDRAVRAVVNAVYRRLNGILQPNRYAGEARAALEDYASYERWHAPGPIMRGP